MWAAPTCRSPGLNSALAPIPLIGPLLTGPRGEGIFGITFAIQGRLSSPDIVVNPFALVTPGFLRELMQLTPEDPRVLPREKSPARNDPAAARASSASPKTSGGASGECGRDARHRGRLVGRGDRLARQEEVIFFTMPEC